MEHFLTMKRRTPSVRPKLFEKLWKDTFTKLDRMNPRVFELPLPVTNAFDRVFSHPLSGSYINLEETEVINLSAPIQWKDLNPTIKRSNVIESDWSLHSFCYKCGKSNLKIQPTSLLESHSVHQPHRNSSNGNLFFSSQRSEMIQCDFCPLFWHLDCLDPPLTTYPRELREDEIEIVNTKTINAIKTKIWKKRPDYFFDEDLLNFDGILSIRKKWMCPCHVDESLYSLLKPIPSSDLTDLPMNHVQQDPIEIMNAKTSKKDSTKHPSPTTSSPKTLKRSTRSSTFKETSLKILPSPQPDDLLAQQQQQPKKRKRIDSSPCSISDVKLNFKKEIQFPFDHPEQSNQSSSSFQYQTINGIQHKIPEKTFKLDFYGTKEPSNDSMSFIKHKYYTLSEFGEYKFDQEMLKRLFPGYDSQCEWKVQNSCIDNWDQLTFAASFVDVCDTALE